MATDNLLEILNYINDFDFQNERELILRQDNLTVDKLYDLILKKAEKQFSLKLANNFQVCLSIMDKAESLI